jgi:hypothetical protein
MLKVLSFSDKQILDNVSSVSINFSRTKLQHLSNNTQTSIRRQTYEAHEGKAAPGV